MSILPFLANLATFFIAASTTYMSTLPGDPLTGQTYRYIRPAGDTDTYTLEACLENESDDKGEAPVDGTAWCSSGWEFKIEP